MLSNEKQEAQKRQQHRYQMLECNRYNYDELQHRSEQLRLQRERDHQAMLEKIKQS